MAVSYGGDDLLEQPGSLLLPQPLAAPHVGVHVPKVLLKEHIGLGVPEDDFDDPGDVSVRRQLDVRPDLVLVVFEGEHLRRGNSTQISFSRASKAAAGIATLPKQ